RSHRGCTNPLAMFKTGSAPTSTLSLDHPPLGKLCPSAAEHLTHTLNCCGGYGENLQRFKVFGPLSSLELIYEVNLKRAESTVVKGL
ncbi:MAG: hypothetical protein ACO34J_10665, partial [Prochlorothrix sp.]